MLTIKPDNGYEKYLCDMAFEKQIPISGTFELLSACNMNCKMCYVRTSWNEMLKQGKILSVDEWVRIAEQAKEMGTLFLLLTGGEPLMYPGFKELYKRISQSGIILTINTNGTLINDEIIELWKEYPPRRVNISLYGSSNATYERLCNNSIGFDQTLNAIKKCIDANIQVKINYTINSKNYDDLDEVIKITEDLNIPISTPTYMFPPIRKENVDYDYEQYRLSPEKASEIQTRVIRRSLSDGSTSINSIFSNLDDVCKRDCRKDEVDVPGGFLCSAGVSSFWINWKGQLTACGMVSNPNSDLKVFTFKEGWNKILEESKKIMTSKKCFNCKYRKMCISCAASSLAETGRTDQTVEWHCELSTRYEKELKKIVEEYKNENK